MVVAIGISVAVTVALSGAAGRFEQPLANLIQALRHPASIAAPAYEPLDSSAAGAAGAPPVGSPRASYAFQRVQSDGVTPVAWSACQPIHYVVRPDGEPRHGAELIRSAVASVSAATGLDFVYDGPSDEAPAALREPFGSDGSAAPVLITWASVGEDPELAGAVAGVTVSIPVDPGGGRPVSFISGHVELDAGDVAAIVDRPRGEQYVRAILLHELGHLVGLDHVDDPLQLMSPVGSTSVLDFAEGDLTGLAALGRGACR